MSDTTAKSVLEAAVSAGVHYIDTATYYGLGLSERRVGEGLRSHREIVVSTKVGRLLQPDRDRRFENRRR
jgi:D-threo-aldose 1-dehydrogenase